MLDNLLVVVGFFMVVPLISLHFVDGLGWAAAVVGLALGLRQLTQQGLGLLGGSLADRFGAKPMIVGGMLLRAAGFASLAWADGAFALILSCVLSGLGGMLFDPPRSALLIKFTRPQERSRFFALLMVQDSVAAMGGALLGTWLLAFDFDWVAWCGCAVFVLAAAANFWLLPAYRVASKRTAPLQAMRTVLQDRRYMVFVLLLSGYYALGVQIMLLMPVVLKQITGTAQAVGWMYSMDTLLSLTLLYPLARWGERHLRLEARVLGGLALMSLAMLAMGAVERVAPAFVVLGLFFVGNMVTEPAREALLARYARPEARASYMGMGRIGLALGGLVGFTGGGALLDAAHAMHWPALPWVVLASVGALTWLGLWQHFAPAARQTVPA